MLEEVKMNLEPLIEAYLLANNPMQLYRQFRENSQVQDLARSISNQSMIDCYNKRAQKEHKILEDIVVSYAILVGLTFMEYEEAIIAFGKLDLSHLDWGNSIREIFDATARITNVLSPRVPVRTLIFSPTEVATDVIILEPTVLKLDMKQTISDTTENLRSGYVKRESIEGELKNDRT